MNAGNALCRALLLSLMLLLPIGAQAAITIRLLTYYDAAPFVISPAQGLSHDLADYLSKRSGGRYHFAHELLPRLRLDRILADADKNWVVAWAVPEFFGDKERTRYGWTETMMRDGDMLVSHVDRPINANQLGQDPPIVFGTILGHRYATLDPLFASGKLLREDAPELYNNLRKLMLRRIDATLLWQSSMDFYRANMLNFSKNVHVSPRPFQSFERRMFTDRRQAELLDYLQGIVQSMPADPAWQAITIKYR